MDSSTYVAFEFAFELGLKLEFQFEFELQFELELEFEFDFDFEFKFEFAFELEFALEVENSHRCTIPRFPEPPKRTLWDMQQWHSGTRAIAALIGAPNAWANRIGMTPKATLLHELLPHTP